MADHLRSRLNDHWNQRREHRVDEHPSNKYPFNEGKTSDGDLLDFLFAKMEEGVITRNDYNDLLSAFARVGRAAGPTDSDDDEAIFDLAVPRHQAKVLRDIVFEKHPQLKHEFEEIYRKYILLTRNGRQME